MPSPSTLLISIPTLSANTGRYEGRYPNGDAPPNVVDPSGVGPYTVASYTSGIPTDTDYVAPLIYYPSGAAGNLPSVAYIAGLNTTHVVFPEIRAWGQHLASHGIVTMYVDATSGGVQPRGRETALKQAIATLAAEHVRSGSPLNGQLNTARMGVMGHSFGGAGALYALQSNTDSRIITALGLSPAPNDGYYGSLTKPAMIMGGLGDPIVADMPAQFASIPSGVSRLFAYFANNTSIDMHDVALYPASGTFPTDNIVASRGTAFLMAYLAGDARYKYFLGGDAAFNTFTYNDVP